jgi:methionyl-tRNA formyltransferase
MKAESSDPRVLVFAYAEVGARCLEILIRLRANVVAVVTHDDDPGETRWYASVAELAEKHGIPVLKPRRLRDPGALDAIRTLAPDLILSFYYRKLIPSEILALPRLGALNMHGSLLPRFRGRAPINWAILHGESETGATLHHMVEEADAGDIVDQERVAIGPEATAAEVTCEVADAACRILERRLGDLLAGAAPRIPQDHARATHFGGRRPEDGRIDWSQSPRRVVDLVRAVTRPFPGAFTDAPGGRLFVWRARAVPGTGPAGTVLTAEPLRVAAGAGAIELVEWSWAEESRSSGPPAAGSRLGERSRGESPGV